MVKLTIEEYETYELLSSLIPYGLPVLVIDGEGVVIDNYCPAIGEYIHLSINEAIGKKYQ